MQDFGHSNSTRTVAVCMIPVICNRISAHPVVLMKPLHRAQCALAEPRAEAASPSLSQRGNCRENVPEVGAFSATVRNIFLIAHPDAMRSESCCCISEN